MRTIDGLDLTFSFGLIQWTELWPTAPRLLREVCKHARTGTRNFHTRHSSWRIRGAIF